MHTHLIKPTVCILEQSLANKIYAELIINRCCVLVYVYFLKIKKTFFTLNMHIIILSLYENRVVGLSVSFQNEIFHLKMKFSVWSLASKVECL